MPPQRTPAAPRFWAKVDTSAGPDACWLWHGTRNRKTGYGLFAPNHGEPNTAHRFAYTDAIGVIEPGKVIAHRCDNPVCCNPRHLFQCTQAENIADKVAKGRQAIGFQSGSWLHPECRPRGSLHGMSKLTEEAVKEIRVSTQSATKLSGQFSVSVRTIYRIRAYRAWAHVP